MYKLLQRLYENYQEKFDKLEQAITTLNAYGQRITFASSRTQMLKGNTSDQKVDIFKKTLDF